MPIGKKNDHMRRCAALVLIFSLLVQIFGCAREAGGVKKLRDIEYEVVAAKDIPQSVAEIIEEKKETGFHFTYSEKEDFYIAVGYGQRDTGGYSISVDEVYETNFGIRIETTLTGPEKSSHESSEPSWPYIVVRIDPQEKPVIFN